jgi:FAD/FMN-containing dehydrogenase
MMQRREFCRTAVASLVGASVPVSQLIAQAHQVVSTAGSPLLAVTGDGARIELKRSAVNTLGGQVAGRVLTAGDEGYDTSRQVLNPAIDKHPALIVQCTGAADVRYAVDFARQHRLLVAVKCGGHSYGGKSTCDDGLMIDLSPLRGVQVDPVNRKARVAGGSLLRQLDHEALAYGLVTTAGTVSHTGVGGLTLGGGFGRLARRFGLALDNVKAVDVVTADAEFLHADAEQNAELYWALRGGGGNFGVATGFEFQLHPMQSKVVGGELLFPLSRARDVLQVYADFSANAPDDVYTDCALISPAGSTDGVAMIHVCYSGSENNAESILAPLRKLGDPISDSIDEIEYEALQQSWDNSDPRAMGEYLKSGFVVGIDERLIDVILDGFEANPGRTSQVFFQQSGGAISRIPSDATAFAHRYATHSLFSTVAWPSGTDGEEHVRWLKSYWPTIIPFTSGFYTNEVSDESQAVVNANYQGNYARLAKIKGQYDPGNLFRLNANVLPARA